MTTTNIQTKTHNTQTNTERSKDKNRNTTFASNFKKIERDKNADKQRKAIGAHRETKSAKQTYRETGNQKDTKQQADE